MKEPIQIHQLAFDQVKSIYDVDYMDEGIAFHTDIRELPIQDGSMRVEMLTIVACLSGRLQVELNTKTYTLRQNEIIVCLPNALIDNCLLSPDFKAAVLCLSQRGVLEHFAENDVWKKAFYFSDHPVVQVSEESLQMFEMYGAMLMQKIKMKSCPFYREIVSSVVKAAIYELLANVNREPLLQSSGLTRQREVLFKRFIELLSATQIKPRYVSWYSQRLCVTPKYLSTICKQVSGKTAFEWINEYVLVDIRHWLKYTNKSVKEIADILEFPDISFFGKYCRAHLGMSPTACRKQLRDLPTPNTTP